MKGIIGRLLLRATRYTQAAVDDQVDQLLEVEHQLGRAEGLREAADLVGREAHESGGGHARHQLAAVSRELRRRANPANVDARGKPAVPSRQA